VLGCCRPGASVQAGGAVVFADVHLIVEASEGRG